MKKVKNSKLKIQNFKKGFTLIEMLIVVVIIGVLAALLMVNFIGVRQRARDAQRKSDLRQIQAALELYRADQGGYPQSLEVCTDGALGVPAPNCTTIYMQKVSRDPLSKPAPNEKKYQYVVDGSPATIYCLRACLENSSDSESDVVKNPDLSRCAGLSNCGSNYVNFTVQTP
ncbi:MAG: prepilin-type N-terminal cleavage/methylation domain-containing protein [Patescibacteria group bacterium]|nr:prepilin-type N-terminal cleavage/methylation domain-containing protein [Patescibacteria group bacterium]